MSRLGLYNEGSSFLQSLESNSSDKLSSVKVPLAGVLETFVYPEDLLNSQLQVVGCNAGCTK